MMIFIDVRLSAEAMVMVTLVKFYLKLLWVTAKVQEFSDTILPSTTIKRYREIGYVKSYVND